jgi:hypothetical protein
MQAKKAFYCRFTGSKAKCHIPTCRKKYLVQHHRISTLSLLHKKKDTLVTPLSFSYTLWQGRHRQSNLSKTLFSLFSTVYQKTQRELIDSTVCVTFVEDDQDHGQTSQTDRCLITQSCLHTMSTVSASLRETVDQGCGATLSAIRMTSPCYSPLPRLALSVNSTDIASVLVFQGASRVLTL